MYTNRKISKKELKNYNEIIPPTYMVQLRANRFYSGMISDVVGDQETDKAIYITYFLDGWIELVWVGYMEKEVPPMVRSHLLYYLIQVEKNRLGEEAKGAFFDIHTDELDDPKSFKHAMMMSGFETKESLDNIYELTLNQVNEKSKKFLANAGKMMKCIPISKADDDLRERVEMMIQEDSRPVPVGMYVNWDDFLTDYSLICMKGDMPCGLLLLSQKMDYIVIECAYVADKMALSSMVGWAYFGLQKVFGGSQKVLIPVVLEKTGLIVEKIAPDAVRGKVLEGIRYF